MFPVSSSFAKIEEDEEKLGGRILEAVSTLVEIPEETEISLSERDGDEMTRFEDETIELAVDSELCDVVLDFELLEAETATLELSKEVNEDVS
jgi:hypothetical protein